jgi:hypothetical protein
LIPPNTTRWPRASIPPTPIPAPQLLHVLPPAAAMASGLTAHAASFDADAGDEGGAAALAERTREGIERAFVRKVGQGDAARGLGFRVYGLGFRVCCYGLLQHGLCAGLLGCATGELQVRLEQDAVTAAARLVAACTDPCCGAVALRPLTRSALRRAPPLKWSSFHSAAATR